MYWPQGWRKKTEKKGKGYHCIWEANLQPLGPNNNPKNAQSWPQEFFFSPDSECKAGQSSASKMSSFQLQDVFYRLSVARQRLYLEDSTIYNTMQAASPKESSLHISPLHSATSWQPQFCCTNKQLVLVHLATNKQTNKDRAFQSITGGSISQCS